MALSPETGILVRDGREERYRAEARRRWRQRRERRGPEPRGPWRPWETEAAGGALWGLLRELSPAPALPRTGLWPRAEGEHVSAVAAFLSQSAGQSAELRDKCPAGICCSSPGPSHTREAGGLGRGSLPQRKVLSEAQVVKCQAGTQTRRPEPAVGPSWALAPCCYAWWERRRPRQEAEMWLRWVAWPLPDGSARQSPWACTAGPRARPLLPGTTKTPGHCGTKGGPGGAADSGRPRTGQGQAQGCRAGGCPHLTGWQARRPQSPAEGRGGPPALEWRPGHHPQGAGSPRLTPGEGGPIAAGPTLRAGGEARPARWRDAREWTGSQQGPPSGLLSTHNVDLGALDRWCPKHRWTHPLQRKRLPLETETLL